MLTKKEIIIFTFPEPNKNAHENPHNFLVFYLQKMAGFSSQLQKCQVAAPLETPEVGMEEVVCFFCCLTDFFPAIWVRVDIEKYILNICIYMLILYDVKK